MHRNRSAAAAPFRRWAQYSILLTLASLCLGCRTCNSVGPDTRVDSKTEETQPKIDTPSPPIGPVSLAADADPVARRDLSAEELDAEVHEAGLLVDVHFELDRFELGEEARSSLANNARYLSGSPSVRLLIEGHCDERGTNEYNLALGQLRASAAREYLLRLGVEADRLDTISYGEERGVCFESRESCWWHNRRAYFRIVSR